MKSSFESHSFAFSPQVIEFSQDAKTEVVASVLSDDPALAELKAHLAALSPDSPWQADLARRVIQAESECRGRLLQQISAPLKSEEPKRTESPAPSPNELLATARMQLQQDYLPLLETGSAPYAYVTNLLNLMDALGLANQLIYQKTLTSVASLESGLQAGDISWAEFQGLLALKNVLIEIGQTQALSEASATRLAVTRTENYPEFIWRDACAAYQNADGFPLVWYQQSYLTCLKQGFRYLQRAIKKNFQSKADLASCLGSFYLALKLDPERSEAPFALACLSTALEQPEHAADFLEYALKNAPQPEMLKLLHILQIQRLKRKN